MSDRKCPACISDPPRPHSDDEIKQFHPRAFVITDADGEKLPVHDFYFNTKARGRRMWLNSLSSVARQIHARLEMATMGYKQELAVKTLKGRGTVPLRPIDVIRDCEISKRDFRRGMDELKAAGLGDRRGTEDGPLHKGKVELYSWAAPRPALLEKGKKGGARCPLPGWFPLPKESALTRFVKRSKLILLPELQLEEAARGPFLKRIEEAARILEKAEKGALSVIKEGCAPSKTGRIDRTDITSERINGASVSSEIYANDGESVGRSDLPETDRPTDPVVPTRSFALRSERDAAIESAIPTALCQRLHDIPTMALIARIDSKLAGAPVENFTERINLKLPKITSLGMLANLAADVGREWLIDKSTASPGKAMAASAEDRMFEAVQELRKKEKEAKK